MAEELSLKDRHEIINKHLGWAGVMVSGSKQAPKSKYGEHLVVWNSNVIIEGYGKVWFGDVDITRNEDKLKALALDLGRKVYVLREMDGRFDNEQTPKIDKAVYVTDGTTGDVAGEYAGYYTRNENNGRIVQKPKEK